MMATEISPNASVKLDSNGNGQVSLTPPSGTVWRLRLANVSTTGSVKQPQAFLYRGSTSGPAEQIDSTYLGNSASSAKVAGAPFYQGQVLWAKWVGGDANATATLQVYGIQGRRGEAPFDEGGVGEGFPLNVATVFQAGNTTVINSSGMFVYSGAPALGNLVASIAPAAGTDSFGNGFGAGIESYGSAGAAAQITGSSIGLFSGLSVIIDLTPSGMFLYSPSGGLGNLVASVTPSAGTDQYGNAYQSAITSYGNAGAFAELFSGALFFKGTASQSSPAAVQTGNLAGILDLVSGQVTGGDTTTELILQSQTAAGVTNGSTILNTGQLQLSGSLSLGTPATPPTPGSGCVLHAGTGTGALFMVKPSGSNIPLSQSSSGGGGNTVTSSSYNDLSDVFSVASSEVTTGSMFRLTAWGHGTFGSTTQNLFMAGPGPNAEAEIPSTAQTASGNALWRAELLIRFTGATTANFHTQLNASGFPGAAGWAANGNTTGISITFPLNVKIQAKWGSTTGAPTITCDGSLFERLAN